MVDLSIILVNWNCLEFTKECLASIRATTHGINYEVLVIDNDSADAPCTGLVEEFPWIKLVLSNKNIGFGPANNLAVRHCEGESFLFLNPDTIVLGDAILQMWNALQSMPWGGAVGCKLLNPDGSLQKTCVQPFPTILNQILALSWLQRHWPSLPLWGRQALYSSSPSKVQLVNAVSGAAIMVKRHVFAKVGGFNPTYFMFAEELDLCLAIQNAGYKVGHVNAAHMIHFGGQSTKKREEGFAAVAMRESVYQFFRHHRGAGYAVVYRSSLFVSALCRMAVLFCLFPLYMLVRPRELRYNLSSALRKWQKIAGWSLGWHPGIHGATGT